MAQIKSKFLSFADNEANNSIHSSIIKKLKKHIVVVGILSFFISLLMLVQPLYMMNVFDRVMTSMSVPTLVSLTLITIYLLIGLGLLESMRAWLLLRAYKNIEDEIGNKILKRQLITTIIANSKTGGLENLQDIRGFMTGGGVTTFFDLPYVPIFLAVMFMMHPDLGWLTILWIIVVGAVATYLQISCKKSLLDSHRHSINSRRYSEKLVNAAETVVSMGMAKNLISIWQKINQEYLIKDDEVNRKNNTVQSMLRICIYLSQITILALAAYLVINQETTPGALFAANILTGRIMGPVQGFVNAWRGYGIAKNSFENLSALLKTTPHVNNETMKLPKPFGNLAVEKLNLTAGNSEKFLIKGVEFKINAGDCLCIVGRSGAGKTTLAKSLVGVWMPKAGKVTLDNINIHQWDSDEMGQYIGYVPQSIKFFEGSIAKNISRFGELVSDRLIEVSKLVGMHEIILALPEGYDTNLNSRTILSTGQRQRIAIARAIYSDVSLVVMDEPNSNLDDQGEECLRKVIEYLKNTKITLVIIAHDKRLLPLVDKVLMLRDGKQVAFGTREAVLEKFNLNAAKKEQNA